MTPQARTMILGVVVVVVFGLIFYFESEKPRRVVPEGSEIQAPITAMNKAAKGEPRLKEREEKAKQYPLAKEITTPDGFINTTGIKLSDLVGKKVVLIDFWTYSCINCQRTIPYLNAWYEKYNDRGLVIIGVHTPEFEFEKKYENVLAAVKKFGIQYPVVLDNDFSTWNAYGNRYWPREYLIDIDGYIVHDHIGEGGYQETEGEIKKLLEERMAILGQQGNVAPDIAKPSGVTAVDFQKVGSPETYFGATRNQYLANGPKKKTGEYQFALPPTAALNQLYLGGRWRLEPEYAANLEADAKIVFRYRAKNVYLVASSDTSLKLSVMLDGKPLNTAAGNDVHNASVTINEDRLYHVIEDPDGYGEHVITITVENPGLKAFTLTFG